MYPSSAALTLVGISLRPSVMPLGPRGIPYARANPTARHASPFDLFMTRAEATALYGALRPRPPAGPPGAWPPAGPSSARGRGSVTIRHTVQPQYEYCEAGTVAQPGAQCGKQCET